MRGKILESKRSKKVIFKLFKETDQSISLRFNNCTYPTLCYLLMSLLIFRFFYFIDRLGDTFRWKGENVSTTEIQNVLMNYHNNNIKITEANVFGVEIENRNGKVAAAVIILDQLKSEFNQQYQTVEKTRRLIKLFDKKQFVNYLRTNLPYYSIPIFLRFELTFDFQQNKTATLKLTKFNYQKQGFNPNTIDQNIAQLFIFSNSNESYVPLTPELFDQLKNSQFRDFEPTKEISKT